MGTEAFSCPLSPNTSKEQTWERDGAFFVCSYCRSLRPEEAMSLARSGWKVTRLDETGEYRICVNMETGDDLEPKVLRVDHYEDGQFCKILEESLGGDWERRGDAFVRNSLET